MYTDQLAFSLVENGCTHQCPWCFFYNEEENKPLDLLGPDMVERFCQLNKDTPLPVRILPPGEPLLHKGVFNLMDIFEYYGFHVNGFYTNFSIPLSDAELDRLTIVDTIVSNVTFFPGEEKLRDIAVQNVRRFLELSKAKGTETFLQFGINNTPLETLEVDIPVEIHRPNLVVVDDGFVHENYPHVADKIIDRYESVYSTFKNLDANKYIEELPKAVCNLRTLSIANDGSYIPCCGPLQTPTYRSKYNFQRDNAFIMPLTELHQSETFKQILKDRAEGELFSICRECNGLSIPQYIPWEV